jgi:hypothetical protein
LLKRPFRQEHFDALAKGFKPFELQDLRDYVDMSEDELDVFAGGAKLVGLVQVDDFSMVPPSRIGRLVVSPVPWVLLARFGSRQALLYLASLHGIPLTSRDKRSDSLKLMSQHICVCCRLFYAVFDAVDPTRQRLRAVDPLSVNIETYKYPPPPFTALEMMSIVRDFCSSVQPCAFEEAGCAVCGQLTLATDLSPVDSLECSLDPLIERGLARRERRSPSDPVAFIDGPIIDSRCNGVCTTCVSALKKGRRPVNSMANGTWLGDVPDVLADLTYAEQCLISRVRCNRYVIRVASGQSKLVANAISFPAPTVKVYDLLPPSRDELEEILAVIFTGVKPPTDADLGRTPLLVRRNRVYNALQWLKLNHSDYSDVGVDMSALQTYPEHGIPVSVVFKPQSVDTNINPAATSVHDQEEEPGTDSGSCPFTVHELIGSNLVSMSTAARKAAALRHLHSGGHVLAVGHSDTPESMYNNPRYYPQMYPWLFPYGQGGLGNARTQGVISESKHKSLLLMFHDKRFQYDSRFVLMAFNQEQMKAGTSRSFILAKRSNFEDVVAKVSSLNPLVVKNIANRMEAGEKVVPTTEEEKMCFYIMDQVEHVGGAVQGSLAGKKRMRTELWSLISCVGAPSWFVTISPVDNRHPICLYWADNKTLFCPDLREYNERARLISSNPVAGARFFHFLVQLFIRHLLRWADKAERRGIFGNTSAYYGTVEQQGRMTLHLHMLIWVSGSWSPQKVRDRLMSDDSEFKAELISYLESCHIGEFMTGSMDDLKARSSEEQAALDDPTQRLPIPPPTTSCTDFRSCSCPQCESVKVWLCSYHETVDNVLLRSNVHKCYARKDVVQDGVASKHLTGKGCINKDGVCTARFPREVHGESHIDEEGRITMKKLEPMINTVNPLISYCFSCNSDTTCLTSGTAVNAITGYVADYLVKMGVKSHQIFSSVFDVFEKNPDIWVSSKSNSDAARRLILKMANSLTSKVEIGGPMAAMYMLGNPDHYTSHTFVPFYWKQYVSYVLRAWDLHGSQSACTQTLATSSSFDVEGTANEVAASNLDSVTLDDVDPGGNNESDKVVVVRKAGGFVSRSNIDDYKLRPVELEEVCLYDWIRCAVRKPRSEVKSRSAANFYLYEQSHPMRDSHGIHWDVGRYQSTIPCILGPYLPRKDAEDRDYYCCTMLTFFLPWRNGIELRTVQETWSDRFDRHVFTEAHQKIIDNMNIRYECYDARDDFHSQLKARIAAQISAVNGDDAEPMEDEDGGANIDDTILDDAADGEVGAWTLRKQAQMTDVERVLQEAGWCVDGYASIDKLPTPFLPERFLPPTRWKDIVDRTRKSIFNARLGGIKDPSHDFEEPEMTAIINDARIVPGAYLLSKFNIQDNDVESHLERIRVSFGLNVEQKRAFNIVAHHALSRSPEPLRMYIGGMGGTGKTTVIRALLQWFEERGEPHRMVVLAPTGAAASIIKGSTYHSFLSVRTGDKWAGPGTASSALADARLRMLGVDYIFLDEISMVSCRDFHLIDSRLKEICRQFDIPFGGVSMIVAGDFAQLPPAKGQALYSGEVSTVQLPRQVQSDQDNTLGLLLWHQFVTVVILKENMRQKDQTAEDQKLRSALENMRFKQCTTEDIMFLRTLSPMFNPQLKINSDKWRNISVITAWNSHKDKINEMNSLRFASDNKVVLHHFYSIDKKSDEDGGRRKSKSSAPNHQQVRLTPSVQQVVWNSPPHTSEHIAGCLSICIDMPVMIRNNNATELCVTKGQEAVVRGWTSREIAGHPGKHALETLFVELVRPSKKVQIPYLPPNVVPLTRLSSYIRAVLPSDHAISLTRQQVPILPNFAMTDYASQGKTRPVNVVDVKHCRNHQAVYTALSRGTTARDTLIIRDFDSKKITGGLSGYLRQEFRLLNKLDEITALQYNGSLPQGIVHTLRAPTIAAYDAFQQGILNIGSDVLTGKCSSLDSVVAPVPVSSSKATNRGTKRKATERVDSGSIKNRAKKSKTTTTTPALDLEIVQQTWVRSWKWDAVNWSCAYDSYLTVLRGLWSTDMSRWRDAFRNHSLLFSELDTLFSDVDKKRQSLDDIRLRVRSRFWDLDPLSFPRGAMATDIYAMAQIMNGADAMLDASRSVRKCRVCLCSEMGILCEGVDKYVVMRHDLGLGSSVSEYIRKLDQGVGECAFCGGPLVVDPSYPDMITFQLPQGATEDNAGRSLIDSELSIRGRTYVLGGVVYHADNHFASRIIDGAGRFYTYDGVLNNGCSVYEGSFGQSTLPIPNLGRLGTKIAVLAVYRKV